MKISLNPSSLEDYKTFLKIKSLPKYRIVGRSAEIPDEYVYRLGLNHSAKIVGDYVPHRGLFDYQRDIAAMAIQKRKYALFMDPGVGKTFIETEFARHAAMHLPGNKCVLMLAPPMVIPQTMAEIQRFYGDSFPIERIAAKNLSSWLTTGTSKIGITNYEALKEETPQGRLGALDIDESGILKSAYGKWGQTIVRLGKGLEWKLAATGTPAPNDRIEYATHAVFLDQYPTVNSFLARFFVNRGQTSNRWELKPHALRPFYRSLSHWCIFMSNPATYGWKDNVGTIPPIIVHIEDVPLTPRQKELSMNISGKLMVDSLGGITSRSQLGQISKGFFAGEQIPTLKPEFIRRLVASWPDRSTIIWCVYNEEQKKMERTFPDAGSISGNTPYEKRMGIIDDFKSGKTKTIISKSEILGYGLNLQKCTRMVFSGLEDSYENYFQCVKRANRINSIDPLHVYIPVTELERPMIDTVIRKAHRIEMDTKEQELLFKEIGYQVKHVA